MITGIDWMKMYVLFKFGCAAACNFDGRLIAMGEDGEAEERMRTHTREGSQRRLGGCGGQRLEEGWLSMNIILSFGWSSDGVVWGLWAEQ